MATHLCSLGWGRDFNGSGTSVWNSVSMCLPFRWVPLNVLRPANPLLSWKMVLLNGLVGRLPMAFQDRPFSLKRTERFCVLLTIRLRRKNVDRNEMAPCVCGMLHASVIAVNVSCGPSARNVFPPANHGDSAPFLSLSLTPRVRFLRLPCSDHQSRCPCLLLSWDLSQFFGTIGPRDAQRASTPRMEECEESCRKRRNKGNPETCFDETGVSSKQ
jgi:hypothetical protein